MTSDQFISHLLEHGAVVVSNEIKAFTDTETSATESLLRKFYESDKMEMPGKAPEFAPEAAIWGAAYLYRAVQLLLMREWGEEKINELLTDFPQEATPSAIYSVDLTLRHLPDLMGLAKGLAPEDPLVLRFRQTARQWPFSSVGIEIVEEIYLAPILSHFSLQSAYIDRIILRQDLQRVRASQLESAVQEALGYHVHQLWPNFKTQSQPFS